MVFFSLFFNNLLYHLTLYCQCTTCVEIASLLRKPKYIKISKEDKKWRTIVRSRIRQFLIIGIKLASDLPSFWQGEKERTMSYIHLVTQESRTKPSWKKETNVS